MINIQGCNVTIMVSNMDNAINFYRDTLGFKLKNRYGDHWADMEGPGIAIGLHPANKDVKIGDNLSMGFKVKDLNEAVEALKQKGVQFKLLDDVQVKLASFTDPDGNSLYLAQSEQ